MNVKSKKENGVVFTPEWVVDFMIDEVFKGAKITGSEKILDSGCGEGAFSVPIVKKYSQISGKSIKDVIENNLYFIDISEEYINKTKQNLQELSNEKITKYNSIINDFCFHDFKEKFNFIIGNPPYVRIQNLNEKRDEIQKKFISASNGSIDLYFCFFEQSLSLLTENGKLSFITPNSHFHSSAGRNLRNLIYPHLTKIINFDHFQVFKDATTYTAITFLNKENTHNFLYTENYKNNFNDIVYKKILKNMEDKSKPWQFLNEEYARKIDKLNKKYSTLQEIANIHYGIATLKDDIYIFSPDEEDKIFFYFKGFKIEKDLCVPIIKASTYKGKNQNLFLIFPYKNEKIISENIFTKKYPEAYKYFLSNRDILEKRDKGGGKNYEEFYSFGRNQSLKTGFGKKIITSTMNLSPHFYVIEDEKTIFYSGYCIKPKDKEVDFYDLCEALNSNLMKEYINSISKSYRGGYKSYAKSFMKDFVHPQFCKIQPSLF
ncbi:MAG: Eco57I restriction-modification methylase domain-containing protein [Candidatus Paceibacterota bacterium]|jgi:adenine-specific DNA-methyltransferase